MTGLRGIRVIWGDWLSDWTASGNAVPHNVYYAYGLPVYKSEVGDPDRYLYSGKEFEMLKGLNLYDFAARTYAPDLARFMQPDPLATENHGVSPYIFCNGDPINYVDPTGEKVYYVDMAGRLVTSDEILGKIANRSEYEASLEGLDRVVIIDQDGKFIRESAKFDEGTIKATIESTALGKDKESVDFNALVIANDDSGQNLFEFMADNITGENGIEYSHIKTGLSGKGTNYVITSHTKGSDAGAGWLFETQLKYGYTLREWNHSHPTTAGASKADIKIRDFIQKNKKYTNLSFRIYHVPTKTYIDYTHDKIEYP